MLVDECFVISVYRLTSGDMMNKKVEAYGVPAVERPKIKATKKLDLTGEYGKQIVLSETKLALRTHQKTFKKLADM